MRQTSDHWPRSPRLGRLALGMAAGAVALAGLAVALIGRIDPALIDDPGNITEIPPDALPFTAAVFAGLILGLVAVVTGIVAVVRRRGRTPGTWAIVVAGALAPLVTVVGSGAMLSR